MVVQRFDNGGIENMKYKVGDKVLVKSIDWYNKNKDKYGDVCFDNTIFVGGQSLYCGCELTIRLVTDDRYYVNENDYYWTDEMIERLVERNGKTYPYKIGDRVILKGNNRCATITDLKYNSWGNLSYYIKIDNDKDISIDYPTELLLPYDNMIEELVKEEAKPEPKFKVGDKIITDTNMKGKIIEVVEEGWYNVEFEPHNGIPQHNVVVPEESILLMEEEIKPKFKVGDKITNGHATLTILTLLSDRYVVEDTFGECGTLYFNFVDDWKIVEEEVGLVDTFSSRWVNEFNLPDGYIFKDENGNIINAQKIVLEKKSNMYPKTYEECSAINGAEGRISLSIIGKFTRLINARNAYWRVAGQEMGLGKPWKPDWTNQELPKYCIAGVEGQIKTSERYIVNTILAFPTAEMRDAFYEVFREEIEICKELL